MHRTIPTRHPVDLLHPPTTLLPAPHAVRSSSAVLDSYRATTTSSWTPSLSQALKAFATTRDGLQTPPPDLSSNSTSLLTDPMRLPQSYQSIDGHAIKAQDLRTMGAPLYQVPSAAPLLQLAPTQHNQRSSPVRPANPQRRSGSSTAIAASMQIPATINNSQGSLAEFAAQITNLFWFESSKTLQRVEESKAFQTTVVPLVPDALPTLGFRKWVTTILATTQVTQNVVLLALMFIYRLKKSNPSVKGKPGSEYRLLTVALMLGNKFLDDNTYTNKTWAEVSGISVQEIHIMEVEFLSNMRYSLFTSETEWKEWHVKLGKFWDYFNKASQQPIETAGPPSLLGTPTLPSPPASTHTSPPVMSSMSPSTLNYPHSLSMPPQLTKSPAFPTDLFSEHDQAAGRTRKRSHDDGSLEPPAKRISRAMAPLPSTLPPQNRLAYSSGSNVQNAPQLPVPNLTIPTAQTPIGLPPPNSRSMSTVYSTAPSSNWPQQTSGSATPNYNFSPFSDQPRAPHLVTSSTASPTSSGYPAPHPHSSPSYFLTQRSSPYRPVRKVSTLLVPPPTEPQNLSLDMSSIHYHPLGRPRNEYKPGVVPYLHADNWPQAPPQPVWPTQPSYNA